MEAVEKESGRKINAVIENAFSGFSDEDLSKSQKRLNDMWGPDEQATSAHALEAGSPLASKDSFDIIPPAIAEILKQTESMLEKASDEDRDEMINLMEDIKDAIKENKPEKADELKKELEDILFYIE